MIEVLEFEKEIITNLQDEKDFLNYMHKNTPKKLILNYSKFQEGDGERDGFGEENVLEYLEEIASIKLSGEKDKSVEENLPFIAMLAFYYLRGGITYLDIVQEGTLGVIKAIENYKTEYGNFENYRNYWVVREIVLFINKKIVDIKNEFKSYFKYKKENFGKSVEKKEKKEILILTEDDVLSSVKDIEKRERLVEKMFDFSKLQNRLTHRQIEVLKHYFGFGVNRRYSIFEIDEKLGFSKGQSELIFEQALLIISTLEGKMYL